MSHPRSLFLLPSFYVFVPQTTFRFGMKRGWATTLTLNYLYLSRQVFFFFLIQTTAAGNEYKMTSSWKTCVIYTTQSLLFQLRNSGNITDGKWVCMMYLFWVQGHFSSKVKPFSQKYNLIFPVLMNYALVLKIFLFAPFALDH